MTQPPPDEIPPGYPAPGAPPAWSASAPEPPGPGHPLPGPPTAGGHRTEVWGPPGWLPTHKPGVVALRPLGLGDLFDGAFTTIRRNPGAMVGLAAAATAAAMVVPVVVALVLAAGGGLSGSRLDGLGGGSDGTGFAAAGTIPYLGTLLSALVTIVLNGVLVRVVSGAVLGERTSAGQAWRAARGRLPALLGLAAVSLAVLMVVVGLPVLVGVLVGLRAGIGAGLAVGIPLGLLGVLALVFVEVRFLLLAAPATVLERTGVLASMRRAAALSRGQFWRILGIQLLTLLLTGVVGQVVGVPLGLVGVAAVALLPGTSGALLLVFTQLVAQVLVAALTTPFSSAVTALQYVDQRIRKEGLDVTLIAASRGAQHPQAQR